MTPEAQRIQIAKACGWEDVREWPNLGLAGRRPNTPMLYPEPLDDFTNDLNAMHDAESCLLGYQMIRYQAELDAVTPKNPHVSCWDIIHATAAERAEAFLKAIGKWEGDK